MYGRCCYPSAGYLAYRYGIRSEALKLGAFALLSLLR